MVKKYDHKKNLFFYAEELLSLLQNPFYCTMEKIKFCHTLSLFPSFSHTFTSHLFQAN